MAYVFLLFHSPLNGTFLFYLKNLYFFYDAIITFSSVCSKCGMSLTADDKCHVFCKRADFSLQVRSWYTIMKIHCCNSGKGGFIFFMRYFTDSAILLLYSMLAFFYVPADQSLVFSLLFTVILGCVTYLCRTSETESWSYNSLPVLKTLRK